MTGTVTELRAPAAEPRSVTVLGSTGSVGANTIDMIERNPGAYRVEALTAHGNVDLLVEQGGLDGLGTAQTPGDGGELVEQLVHRDQRIRHARILDERVFDNKA